MAPVLNLHGRPVSPIALKIECDLNHFGQLATSDQRYTRNLIDEGNGKYNLILLCWAESKGSAIHSHSNSHCFMKCLEGELTESQFEWPDEHVKQEMVEKKVTPIRKNEVAYINGTTRSLSKNSYTKLVR